jgi:dolichol-phosphate mannosyltransferase
LVIPGTRPQSSIIHLNLQSSSLDQPTTMPPTPPTRVFTILPTYNERDNIGLLIDGVLENAISPHCVIVVDDNSPDGTAAVVLEAAQRWNQPGAPVRVILNQRVGRRGLTSAIQEGIDLAVYTFGADVVTWMDCDLSMPPEDVPRLVRAVEAGADLAVGSRWAPGGADVAHDWSARTLSRAINAFARTLIGPYTHDYTSGFVAGRAHLFKQVRLRGDYGEYCIDLLGRAGRADYTLVDIPYICVPRTAGESKTGAHLGEYLSKGRHYVTTVWNVRRGQ